VSWLIGPEWGLAASALYTVGVQDLAGDEGRILQIELHLTMSSTVKSDLRCRAARPGWASLVCMGVSMTPAETAFTRIPFRACAIASYLVAAARPPLVSDANADGTLASACSTSVVVVNTT
jgi:hypothetical protein